jgi:hypothetical protein
MGGLVKNCLNAIRENLSGIDYEIIVVDNASNDNIQHILAEQFPEVRFLAARRNNGMGSGNNIGIRAARGEHILILNPDIFIYDDAILKLLNFLKENAEVGLVAPRLLNGDKTLQHTAYRWHSFLTPLVRRTFLGNLPFGKKELARFLMTDWDHATICEVDWIQGSCILVPRKVFAEIGLFDESFFMYFEDTDLCRRIKQANYRNVYYAEAEVIHLHGRQSGGGVLQVIFNKLTRTHIISWFKYLWKWRRGN